MIHRIDAQQSDAYSFFLLLWIVSEEFMAQTYHSTLSPRRQCLSGYYVKHGVLHNVDLKTKLVPCDLRTYRLAHMELKA
jgi:hypothetical protein